MGSSLLFLFPSSPPFSVCSFILLLSSKLSPSSLAELGRFTCLTFPLSVLFSSLSLNSFFLSVRLLFFSSLDVLLHPSLDFPSLFSYYLSLSFSIFLIFYFISFLSFSIFLNLFQTNLLYPLPLFRFPFLHSFFFLSSYSLFS